MLLVAGFQTGRILGPPRNWGSSGDRRWRGYVVRWIKLLSEVETERAIVERGATNLKQECPRRVVTTASAEICSSDGSPENWPSLR